jgi:photosystem I P700 chlorophyll a apoprotein A2
VSLFLGFHTLGLYVHNDVVVAFGTPEKQILVEPVFAQWIQAVHGKTALWLRHPTLQSRQHCYDRLAKSRQRLAAGWMDAINSGSNSLFLTIGPGDFLVHHAIALGLHTTTLILGQRCVGCPRLEADAR